MDEWLKGVPRWNSKDDRKVDDDTEDGFLQNYRTICRLIDSHVDEVKIVMQPPLVLSGAEILAVNTAFYRYEMLNKIPPASLAVDCTIEYHEDEHRDTVVCDSKEIRLHRAAFSFDYRTDGIERMLVDYDRKLNSMIRFSNCTEPLPRDWSTNPKLFLKNMRLSTSKWRAPKAHPYTDGLYPAVNGKHKGCLNLPPSTHMGLHDSMREARQRLVSTLGWFRRHQRMMLNGMITAMRKRAHTSANLYLTIERMKNASLIIQRERARAPDVLTSMMKGNAGDELGQALLPYVPYDSGTSLISTCRTIHDWGARFQRRVRLRAHNDAPHDKAFVPHRVEPDGSFTMLKNKKISLNPVFEHRFLVQSGNGLVEQSFVHLKHGNALETQRSTISAFLVLDDEQRTKVTGFGLSMLRRWDNQNGHAQFPKGQLPNVVVSTGCLSSDFGKFRIVIVVSLLTENATMELVYTAETPPFRVVSRIESKAASAASKRRKRALRIANFEHVKIAREHNF